MSLDYPDRSVWLAKRETWRDPQKYQRVIWDSARKGTYVRAKHGPIGRELERRRG